MAAGLTRGLVFIASMASGLAAAGEPVLGIAPTYSSRTLGTIPAGPLPNEAAITRRIWAPGIDDGYVPQGLTVVGGAIYLGTYRSVEASVSRGPCRVFRIAPASGTVTGSLDLPPSCGHAGGLARGGAGRIWLVDTQVMFEVELTPADPLHVGKILREVRLGAPLKGSFAAGDGTSLWLGGYERDGPGRLHRVPLSALAGAAVGVRHATRAIDIPSRAQGAAFDNEGRLWMTRSGATFGEILRLDPETGAVAARFAAPDGIEDLSFGEDGAIWTVSEAGSRRWKAWATHFPVVFRLEPRRLR